MGQGWDPPRLWVVNVSDGSLLHTLTLPDPCWRLYSVAVLDSGHLMISYWRDTDSLAVYRSVTDSPTLLTNLTTVGDSGPVLTKSEIADFTDISVQILVGTR